MKLSAGDMDSLNAAGVTIEQSDGLGGWVPLGEGDTVSNRSYRATASGGVTFYDTKPTGAGSDVPSLYWKVPDGLGGFMFYPSSYSYAQDNTELHFSVPTLPSNAQMNVDTKTPVTELKLTSDDVSRLDALGVTLERSDGLGGWVPVNLGEVVGNRNLRATVSEGSFYETNPTGSALNVPSIYWEHNDGLGVQFYPQNYTFKDGNATVEFYLPSLDSTATMFVYIELGGELEPLLNSYLLNVEQLRVVNRKRYVVDDQNRTYDHGQTIVNLMTLPIDPEALDVVEGSQVMLGSYPITDGGSPLTVPEITSNAIALDLGTIVVDELRGDAFDYMGAKAVLSLPFLEPFEIDVEHATAGVEVELVVTLGSGMVQAFVRSGGEIVASSTGEAGTSVPLSGDFGSVSLASSYKYSGFNQVYGATLAYHRMLPTTSSELLPIVSEVGTLSGVSGLVEVQEINLSNVRLSSDRDELLRVLRQGVVIK